VAITKEKVADHCDKKDLYIMKMLLLALLLLWNDKEGAHAKQGKQTYCVDMPSFLIVVVDCNRSLGEEEL